LKSYNKFILILLLLLILGLTGCGDKTVTNVGKLNFENPLDIPELLEPTIGSDGTKQFTLTMQSGTTEFLPGKKDGYLGN
jgi:suppressor of ftsI